MNDGTGGLNLTIVIEPDEEGGYIVHCPELKGCWSCGDTEEEALANIEEAIIGCLKVRLRWAIEDVKQEINPIMGYQNHLDYKEVRVC